MDIVVRVAIIWHQGTTGMIASNFHLVCIDMIHWSNDRLSIDLDNGIVGRDSCGSDLWIDMRRGLHVTSSLMQLVAMGAQNRLVLLVI